jgi:hypothetical protein
VVDVPEKLSSIQQMILGVLSDNAPHRKFEVVEAMDHKGPSTAITKALGVLVASGLAKRFKHGIYGSPQADERVASALPPRMNKSAAHTTYGKVIGMINEHPVTAVQIRERWRLGSVSNRFCRRPNLGGRLNA